MTAPSAHALEYGVIAVYLLFLAATGPAMRRFNQDGKDYFIGGARTSWWLMGPSLALGMVSAYVFTGVAGALYEGGLAPLFSNFGILAAGMVLATFLAGWYRQLRLVTGAEVIRMRFGRATEQCYAYLFSFLQPVYASFQLLGLAIFISAVFSIPLTVVVLALGLVVAFYSVSGGRWAVMATDFIQSLVLLPVVVAVAVLGIREVGGWGSFMEKTHALGGFALTQDPGTFSDNRYTLAWGIAVFAMQFVNQLNLGWASKYFTAKDGAEARKAAWFTTALILFGTIFYSIPSFVSKILYSDQVAAYSGIISKPEESAYIVACLNLLPTGLIGLVIVAMFSATASSMDSALNLNAAVIVRNILPPLRRLLGWHDIAPHRELASGRRVTLVLAIAVIGITFYFALFGRGGIFEMVLGFATAVNYPMTLPFVLVLIFRKAPRLSAIFSIGAGLAGPWILIALARFSFGFEPDFAVRVVIITLCSLTGFFSSYAFKPRVSEEANAESREFYKRLRQPVDFEKEVGRSNDAEQLKIIGLLSLLVGFMILALVFLPNTGGGKAVILSMGSTVTAVGTLFYWRGSRLRKNNPYPVNPTHL